MDFKKNENPNLSFIEKSNIIIQDLESLNNRNENSIFLFKTPSNHTKGK